MVMALPMPRLSTFLSQLVSAYDLITNVYSPCRDDRDVTRSRATSDEMNIDPFLSVDCVADSSYCTDEKANKSCED